MMCTGIRVLLVLAAVAASSWGATPSLSVSPDSTEVRADATRQFTANVRNVTNTAVTWLVNGVVGGNATVGRITASGLYTAPAAVPADNTITIQAKSVAVMSLTGNSAVTLLNPRPDIDQLVPSGINTGPFRISIRGQNFVRGAKVALGGTQLAVTFVSGTELQVSGTAGAAGARLPLTVTNPEPGSATAEWQMTVLPPASVNILSGDTTLATGEVKVYSVHMGYLSINTLHWKVNGVAGGNATVGTITSAGVYTAPATAPANNRVTISATSTHYATATDSTIATIVQPVPVIGSLSPSSVAFGQQTVRVNGSGFTPRSQVMYVDRTVPTTFISPTALEATVTAAPLPGGRAAIHVRNPDPGSALSTAMPLGVGPASPAVSYLAAVRFLRQASFGPSPEAIVRVQQLGFNGWLQEQRTLSGSTYGSPGSSTENMSVHRSRFFLNAINQRDQLRQRMAFALGQLFVTSAAKVGRSEQMLPYQKLLLANSFSTFDAVLRAVTLSPTMGRYLDMVNNEKFNAGRNQPPNENFAREMLQLFTVGMVQLRPDGTPQSGNPAAYTEQDVKEFTRALTGWNYPPKPGASAQVHNPEYYEGQLVAWEATHDTGPKTLLRGVTLPAGQSAAQDLSGVLQNVFEHPNVPPFVAVRLIRHFVMSNPSPAYVQRIAAVFSDNGAGVRGDLFAVVRAILLDPEARAGDTEGASLPSTAGKLQEPVLFITNMMLALNATAAADHVLPQNSNAMGQNLFFAPSVFNYFSPLAALPNSAVIAPEFQTLTPSTAVYRANFLHSMIASYMEGVTTPLGTFEQLADNPPALIDAASRAVLGVPATSALRDAILPAVLATKDLERRAQYALYLVSVSGLRQAAQ